MLSEFQNRIDALSSTLAMMDSTTKESSRCCDLLTRRSKQLNSLTSPASDASQKLTRASQNLSTTLALMKDSREKFDTVADCEPSIKRLYTGATKLTEVRKKNRIRRKDTSSSTGNNSGAELNLSNSNHMAPNNSSRSLNTLSTNSNLFLSEQDVYSAADSMDILRDAYSYFSQRKKWRSTPSALGGLERVHQLGVDGMCLLVQSHLTSAGPAIQSKGKQQQGQESDKKEDSSALDFVLDDDAELKRNKGSYLAASANESAIDVRKRISNALHNRDLMKAIGEYEEYLPLDNRSVRELRAIFECLGSDALNPNGNNSAAALLATSASIDNSSIINLRVPTTKVVRTEKIGSGCFTNLTKAPLKTGYPHLNAYGEARKVVAYAAMNGFHRHLRDERRKKMDQKQNNAAAEMGVIDSSDIDAAARDAIRCLEHALVVVAGEKSIYKCVVSPTSSHNHDTSKISNNYKEALLAAYNHIVSSVVDRTMDIIETVFLKEAGMTMHKVLTHSSGDNYNNNDDDVYHYPVRIAASSTAAGLRILDGVRMLGPSLAKLCDMGESKHPITTAAQNNKGETIAGSLCICIHRLTVKNTAKVMENLAKAIHKDPHDGEKFRPPDARVAAVSSEVCLALSVISPFLSAYKSVSKRRALPWDQNIGDEASDMDSFVRFLVSCLLTNLKAKSENYLNDPGPSAYAKSCLFMMNNTFYLLEYQTKTLAKISDDIEIEEDEHYILKAPWFKEKVGKLFDDAKEKYLTEWEGLNRHLTSVDKKDLTYQSDKLLSLESGRLIKTRFSGFIEEFDKIYAIHDSLAFPDQKLQKRLKDEVKKIFLRRYKKFYEKYSQLQFSKKKMDEYLKYPPKKVEIMIDDLFNKKT